MVLFVHGFRSCGKDKKADSLSGTIDLLYRTFPISPKKQIKAIEKLIKKHHVKTLIAASLGGFYATYLATKYNLKVVLINPSVMPYSTLKHYTYTRQKRFCTNRRFMFKPSYLNDLKRYRVKSLRGEYLVLLKKEDKVLDHKVAKRFYKRFNPIIDQGNDHAFENLDDYISEIENFIKN